MDHFANTGTSLEVPVPYGRRLDKGINVLFRNGGWKIVGPKGASGERLISLPNVEERYWTCTRVGADVLGADGGKSIRRRGRHRDDDGRKQEAQ